MNWILALNRRILVAFFIGDTHTLERELSPTPPPPPPKPLLSWFRCRGMFMCNYPGIESHRPFQFLIHQGRAFDHQMVDLHAGT